MCLYVEEQDCFSVVFARETCILFAHNLGKNGVCEQFVRDDPGLFFRLFADCFYFGDRTILRAQEMCFCFVFFLFRT